MISEEKQHLRRLVRSAEGTLSPQYRQRSNGAVCRRLAALPEYQSARTVFCFVGTESEIDTRPFLTDVLNSGKTLCVPLCVEEGRMELRKITALSQLAPGKNGIPEPAADAPEISADDVDFAVIPCVTCDREGHRLGHGGGYYDRFLSGYRSAAVLVCREQLLRDEIPVAPLDAIVHWVVTERCLYEDGIPARME